MITYAPDKKEFCLKLGAIIAVGVIVIALAVIIGVVYLLGTKLKEKGKIERIKIVCETLRKTQKDPIIHKDEVQYTSILSSCFSNSRKCDAETLFPFGSLGDPGLERFDLCSNLPFNCKILFIPYTFF